MPKPSPMPNPRARALLLLLPPPPLIADPQSKEMEQTYEVPTGTLARAVAEYNVTDPNKEVRRVRDAGVKADVSREETAWGK